LVVRGELPTTNRESCDAREAAKVARRHGKVDGDGRRGDNKIVRADGCTLRREFGAEPGMHAGRFEVERNNRHAIDQALDESLGLRLFYTTSEPVHAMQQLRSRDRGDRDLVVEVVGKRGFEVELARLTDAGTILTAAVPLRSTMYSARSLRTCSMSAPNVFAAVVAEIMRTRPPRSAGRRFAILRMLRKVRGNVKLSAHGDRVEPCVSLSEACSARPRTPRRLSARLR
jgi:hypothetical protein